MNENIIVNVDTDSIMIAKADHSEWGEDEQDMFVEALNAIFPEKIKFEHDGYYESVLVLASKNYVLKEKGSEDLKVKGSGLKDQKKEPALREMIDSVIDAFMTNRVEEIPKIYEFYIEEALNAKDISRWSQKKTVTAPILRCNGHENLTDEQKKEAKIRSNETVLWDAIKDEELIQLGDKFYVFAAILDEKIETTTLKNGKVKEKKIFTYGNLQPKYWNGKNHDVEHLMKRIYSTMQIFEAVLDLKSYKNYSLAKNYKELLDNHTQTRYTQPSEENNT